MLKCSELVAVQKEDWSHGSGKILPAHIWAVVICPNVEGLFSMTPALEGDANCCVTMSLQRLPI